MFVARICKFKILNCIFFKGKEAKIKKVDGGEKSAKENPDFYFKIWK